MNIEYLVREESEISYLKEAIKNFRKEYYLNDNFSSGFPDDSKGGKLIVKANCPIVNIYPKTEKDEVLVSKKNSQPILIQETDGYKSGKICIKLGHTYYCIHSKPEY